jgi:hypothetical protein
MRVFFKKALMSGGQCHKVKGIIPQKGRRSNRIKKPNHGKPMVRGKALPRHALHTRHYTQKRVLGKPQHTMNKILNKVQINETVDTDAEGNILKKGMMINIRADNVNEAATLYRQLKAALNGNGKSHHSGPTCECGSPMMLRNGSNGPFYGCSSYPRCRNTQEVQEAPYS